MDLAFKIVDGRMTPTGFFQQPRVVVYNNLGQGRYVESQWFSFKQFREILTPIMNKVGLSEAETLCAKQLKEAQTEAAELRKEYPPSGVREEILKGLLLEVIRGENH